MMLAREASIISIILSFTIPTPPTSTITYCLCPYSCYRCLLLLSGEVAGPAPAATPEIGQRPWVWPWLRQARTFLETPTEAHPSWLSKLSRFERVPEGLKSLKRNPNDADDAGAGLLKT